MALLDKQLIYRIACCGLDSAKAALEAFGQPVPERCEILAHAPAVFPGCCDAMSLRATRIRNLEPGDDCGLQNLEITWQLQISRCVNVPDPKEPCCVESGDCRDPLHCPEPVPVIDCDPCEARSKAHESSHLYSDMWTLASLVASEWKLCLCHDDTAPYPDDCEGDDCGPGIPCQYIRLGDVQSISGGGCAGWVFTFTSRHR